MELSDKKSLYKIFIRKKKNGKKRIIHAPCEDLKKEQRNIKNRLEQEEWISIFCHGFKKKSNCSDAAKIHTNKDWVLNVDIANFFTSIKKEQLYFLDEYEKEISTLNDVVIQGSPCSPIISNIILREFDEDLNETLMNNNIDYSRYADDITLSGYDKPDLKYLLSLLSARLEEKGFKIRKDKTTYMYKNKRQNVLGIVVNEKASLNRKARKNLRAAIYKGNITDVEKGYLSYLRSINKEQYDTLIRYKDKCDKDRLLKTVA